MSAGRSPVPGAPVGFAEGLPRAPGRAAWRLLTLVAICLAAAATAGHAAAPGPDDRCTAAAILFETGAGPVGFTVEIADDPAEQARGLMFRDRLAPEAGMLFVYDPPQPAAFWMKNTMIPLDMLFIDDTGRVLNIAERTVPYSLEARRSEGAVRAVLEINGGLSETLGIGPGSQAVHPVFRAAPDGHRCPAP